MHGINRKEGRKEKKGRRSAKREGGGIDENRKEKGKEGESRR